MMRLLLYAVYDNDGHDDVKGTALLDAEEERVVRCRC